FQSLSSAEIGDIASESLTRLMEASRARNFKEGRPRAPYVTRIAHNLALTRLRRPTPVDLDEAAEPPMSDDELAKLLDARASSERLDAALMIAGDKGDHMVIRVVRVWLQWAYKNSVAPPSRDVAERLGVSDATVNDALARLRAYLPE